MIIKTFLHQKAIFTSQGEVRASEMDLKKKKKIKNQSWCTVSSEGAGGAQVCVFTKHSPSQMLFDNVLLSFVDFSLRQEPLNGDLMLLNDC